MSLIDRLGRCLFVAAAVGLAWGIRGDFGHIIGAMYPGAILGLAWVYVCGSPDLLNRMPVIAGLMAGGIGIGGMMSYGILHGYAQADTFQNYSYGFFTLFCQGGCWGTFGCALAGLMAERKPMRTGEWIGLIVCVIFGSWTFSTIVVDLIGFHVNPPRNDISIAFLGAAIGMFVWLITHQRPLGLRGATFGFVGFGLGMAGGRLLANACRHLESIGWSINHWNVMEITCGFVGGGVFCWGMLDIGKIEYEENEEENNALKFPNWIGSLFVLGGIPLLHLIARVPERYPKWAEEFAKYGVVVPAEYPKYVLTLLIALCSCSLIAAIVWMWAIAKSWRWPAVLPILFLSLVMLLFQNLTAHFFWYPHRSKYLNTHYVFWILFGVMTIYPLIGRPHNRPFDRTNGTRLSLFRLVLISLLCFSCIIALAAVVNGELTMKSANTRWPQWSWSNGPFPR